MGKQKKYAEKRLPKGFNSWDEFAAHARKKKDEKEAELKRLAELGRKAEQEGKQP